MKSIIMHCIHDTITQIRSIKQFQQKVKLSQRKSTTNKADFLEKLKPR